MMGLQKNFSPVLIVPTPALMTPLPVNTLSNKLAPKLPNNFEEILLFILSLHC